MDRNQALQEVKDLGGAYFYDADAETTNEEIVEQIREDILTTLRLTGLDYWKRVGDALRIVLAECSEEKLDGAMKAYNLPLRYVGGRGRNLLERLYQAITEAISTREKTLKSL